MSSCSTGCPTQNHESYGQCMKAKSTVVAYCNSAGGQDYTAQKRLDRDLADYKQARSEGIQPAGTDPQKVTEARRLSDLTGSAFQA